ncbi:hypothetical protein TNCV_1425741 [Trichonephila clavipes]|nr:hypothetical protein TNCV_1425741 [Trichonephila clavipes]
MVMVANTIPPLSSSVAAEELSCKETDITQSVLMLMRWGSMERGVSTSSLYRGSKLRGGEKGSRSPRVALYYDANRTLPPLPPFYVIRSKRLGTFLRILNLKITLQYRRTTTFNVVPLDGNALLPAAVQSLEALLWKPAFAISHKASFDDVFTTTDDTK